MNDRVTDLEIKVAHLEDHLNVLNDTVVRQQAQIDELVEALRRVRDRLDAGRESSGSPAAEERPPHY